MLRSGIFLFILGIGSFVLPLFDLQFRLFDVFGEYQTEGGIGLIVAGAAVLGVHFYKSKQSSMQS